MKQRGKKKKELKKMRTNSENSGTMFNAPHLNHRSPRKKRQKGHEKILEKISVENFPKMGRK